MYFAWRCLLGTLENGNWYHIALSATNIAPKGSLRNVDTKLTALEKNSYGWTTRSPVAGWMDELFITFARQMLDFGYSIYFRLDFYVQAIIVYSMDDDYYYY